MTETEDKIVEAAIRVFVRYGARKASMADIASNAGVSRQTLYDLFGAKDELIRASIRSVTDQSLARVRERLGRCATLAEKLDAYFDETIVKSFELLETAGDPEDLISGHNAAGKDEIDRSHQRHEALIAELLDDYRDPIEASGQSVADVAHLIVTVAMGFKTGARSRADLDGLIGSFKIAVLTIVDAKG
ncbi:TetR/AcrR family transcriptional regulator [Bauldia sp.]|uniref:TetR/AcrR family transcriptional regulator n=1 Tax=Bauldia sp. TaxID=2575872 RepID=UPI003BA9BE4F